MSVKDSSTDPQIRLSQVFGAFWVGVKEYPKSFYLGVCAYTVVSILSLIMPLYYKKFFDVVSSGADKSYVVPTLTHFIIIVLILNSITWVFRRVGSVSASYNQSKVMARLQEFCFEKLVHHSYSFFSNNFTGALVQKIGRFVRAFEKLSDLLLYNIIPLAIQIIGVVAVLYTKQPLLSLIIAIWIVIVMTFSFFYSRWRLQFNIEAAKADSAVTALIADNVTNHTPIITFAAESAEVRSVSKLASARQQAVLKSWIYSEYLSTVQSAFLLLIEFFLFYYGIRFWASDAISVGTFVLIQVYIIGLSYQLFGFSSVVRGIYESVADAKEMVDILNLSPEIADLPGSKKLEVAQGLIEFKNLSFNFNETKKVLENLNLTIKPGEKVALIGPSGAGKSTIVRLLLRLYSLKEGEILIDSQDIKKVTQESLRANISLVPQDPVLFHRSLMENIRYGRRDATDEEVIEAAKLAHCDEFIDTLPDGYKTFVGERGIKLSGGERQRVAIARAILKNAPILILDEATSSLDSHSESLIQDALDKLMQDRTAIVIAHRLSTIRKMDRIIVVKNGAIEEEGTHDDLVKRDESLYKTLWNLQAGGFIAE